MDTLKIQGRKVIVSAAGVASFNRAWPCSTLRDRSYWFEFGADGDLVDTDTPEHDDGPAAAAMSDDCKAFLLDGTAPAWAPDAVRVSEDADDVNPDGVPFFVDRTEPGEFFAFALHPDGETDGDNILGPYPSKAEAFGAAMTPGAFTAQPKES